MSEFFQGRQNDPLNVSDFDNRDDSLMKFTQDYTRDHDRSFTHTPLGRRVSDHDKLFVPYLDDIPGERDKSNLIEFNERRSDLSPDKEIFYQNMKDDRYLRQVLEGIDLKEVSDDEFAILLVWTAPLVTKIAETTLASQRARSILGVNAIEAQGLIRKTENQIDNLISIVETFYKHQKNMPEEKFLLLLKNCVYSMEKAIEIKVKMKELGEMWTIFKRDLQLKSGSQFLNFNLQKPIPALKQVSKSKSKSSQLTLDLNPGLLNLEILIRVLPFWDTPLAGLEEDCINIRKLLSLSKSEARNICENFKVTSLGQLLGKLGESLLRHKSNDVEESIQKCLFNDRQKSKDFTKALSRIAFEKSSAHPTFINAYLSYNRLKKQETGPPTAKGPAKPPRELYFLYYKFPLTAEQINSLCFYVIPTSGYSVHTISFKDLKVSDACLIEMKKFLVNNKWKGTRSTTKGLFALELYNNNLSIEAFTIFCEAFLEKIGTNKVEYQDIPMIATTLRVLTIDRNNLSDMGTATLSKHLDVSKSLVSLSLKHNNIGVGGAAHISKALTYNIHLRYLNLSGNPLENYGIAQLGKALKNNKSLETLDLSDVYFTDEACLALNDGLLLNRSLRTLIMSNTFVSKTPSSLLVNTFKNSRTLKVLRWGNLKYFAEPSIEYLAGKILCTEYLKYPVALITPYVGDLHVSLLNDICKFQVPVIYQQTQILYTDQGRSNPIQNDDSKYQRDGNKIDDKQVQRDYMRQQELFRSYFTFIVHFWQILKNGDVPLILQRPSQSPTGPMPFNQESELLKDLIAKSEYKNIHNKYVSMVPQEYLEHFNKRDDSFMELKFQSTAKAFVNKQGINDQYLFDNEYIVHEEEIFKLRGYDTKLLNFEIFEQLFYYGFDPFIEDKDGIDAFMEAVMEGDVEILELLLSKGGSLNKIYSGSQNIQDFCVYHFAVLSNRIEMLTYILENKQKLGISVDLNYKNRQGDTAGQLASRLTKFEFAKLIFEYGGITELPLIKNLDGNGPIDKYYRNANFGDLGIHPDIEEQLNEPDEDKMEYPPLIESILRNDEDKFLKLMNSKIDINQRDPNMMSPLHHALFLEREHLAAYLLERGCSVNLKDKANMTPLHVAVIKSSPQLIATLIKHGADVDAVNLDGNTPLHLAAKRRRVNVVKMLLDEKAEPYLFNLIHKTAAQMTDDQEIRDLIRKAGNKKKIIMNGAEKIAYGKS